jgi:hypothetical protein
MSLAELEPANSKGTGLHSCHVGRVRMLGSWELGVTGSDTGNGTTTMGDVPSTPYMLHTVGSRLQQCFCY